MPASEFVFTLRRFTFINDSLQHLYTFILDMFSYIKKNLSPCNVVIRNFIKYATC